MRKKNRTKLDHEREYLQTYYERSKGSWPREDLELIAIQLGVSRQTVYKYLWDLKNNQRQRKIKQQYSVQSQMEVQQEPSYSFTYNIGVNGQINVPENLHQAFEFTIDPKVSIWAMDFLKYNGWEFVLEDKNNQMFQTIPEEPEICEMVQNEGEKQVKNVPQVEMVEYELSPVPQTKQFDAIVEQLEEKYPFLKSNEVHASYAKTPKNIEKTAKKNESFNEIISDKAELMGRLTEPRRRSLRFIASSSKRQKESSEEEVYESGS